MTIMDRPAGNPAPAPPPPALQQRVPRDVPPSARLSLRLGGAIGVIGWALFGFGMIFFWVFVMSADVASLWQFSGPTATTAGQVTDSYKTRFTVGGSRKHHRPGTPVFANAYTFTAPDGTEHRGLSYATGTSLDHGQSVTIEYPVDNPAVSRIAGMRTAPLGPFVGLVALAPVVGLGLILGGMRRGGRYVSLLENGRLAWATLAGKEPTSARVNNKPIFKLTFEFTADNRRTYQVIAKTHATAELEDEDHELVLYDPANPAVAVVADSLPAGIRIDERGRVHQRTPLFVWLVLPMLSLVGHGTWFVMNYIR